MNSEIKNIKLSVVIIARNEEKNISRCIESVLLATREIDDPQIILVDSASTDRTVEIAMNYPIEIIRLKPEWPLSAAAGRYIGFLQSSGDYIQFQDGDTTLNEDWFKYAIPHLKKDENVAGVVGITTQEEYNTRDAKKFIEKANSEDFSVNEIDWYAGDSLLKRSILQDVGSFNPYLLAGEEGELSYRIIFCGFKLLRIPHSMSHHFGYDEGFNISREIRGSRSQGQIFRHSLENNQIFRLRLDEYKFKILSTILTLFFIISIGIFLFFGNLNPLYLWIICGFLFFGLIFYEKRNLSDSIMHLISQTSKWPFFMCGFLEPKKDGKKYPKDIEKIK